MAAAALTSKGQITIPVSVRVALGLEAGDRVESRVLVVENLETVVAALRLFSAGQQDFADCLISSTARKAGCQQVCSVDRTAIQRAGMVAVP